MRYVFVLMSVVVFIAIVATYLLFSQDNGIDKVGYLTLGKGVYFCFDNTCNNFVKDLGSKSDFGYSNIWNLAGNNTRVHIIGKIEAVPANRQNCEVSQIGCEGYKEITIESMDILP